MLSGSKSLKKARIAIQPNTDPARKLSLLLVFLMLTASLVACQRQDEWKDTLAEAEKAKAKNDLKNASAQYVTAIKQMDQVHADQKQELAALNELIDVLLKSGELSQADNYAQKALSLAERIFGPDHIDVLPQVVLLRTVAEKIPDRGRMAIYLDRMIEIQQKRTGPDSVPVMWLLDEYARSKSPACGDKYDTDKLKQLLRLRQKFAPPHDINTIRVTMTYADSLAQDGKISEATALYESCLQDARAKRPGLLPELLLRYGRYCIKRKNNSRAEQLLHEAYVLSGPQAGAYNLILTPEIAGEYGDVLLTNKRKKEAAEVYSAILTKLKSANNIDRARYFEARLKECK